MLNSISAGLHTHGSSEYLQNIFSSYTPNDTFIFEMDDSDIALEAPALSELPEVIEELILVPIAEGNAHPVSIKLSEPSKLQKVFSIFRDMTGKLPELVSIRPAEDLSSVMVSTTLSDGIDEDEVFGGYAEVKRYEFKFVDMEQYQAFVAQISSFVSFFKMPKNTLH